MRKNNKTLSLQDLTTHQQRIRQIVQHIKQYSPTFHINKNYSHANIINKIKQSRQSHQDKIFQQNMKIIERLQSVQSKVNTKQFPTVNMKARLKRKHRSLSQKKQIKSKSKKKYLIKDEDSIFQENIQLIQKLQSAQKKIQCWQQRSIIKSRVISQKRQALKRNQMLKKFKDISRQLSQLRVKKVIRNQNTKQSSPYLLKSYQHMKKTSHTMNQMPSFNYKHSINKA